jgi:hypothetical protein
VSADSCSECSRNTQLEMLEMKTAGNRRVDCCEPRLLNVWNSNSAIGMSVTKSGCN